MGKELFTDMNDKKLINDALMLAIKAHGNQRRKYTGEKYIVHPIAVSEIIETVDHTSEMIAAALLHDVVEDTYVTLQDIRNKFGPVVANYVHYCTNVSDKVDGNRAFRKKMDADHFALGPAESQTIKVADLINNSETIIKYDQNFFHRAYKHEKRYMLEILVKADPILLNQAKSLLEAAWDPS
jgi:(p)ppGpp synthase/HD superfamily hydrolase